MHPVRRALRRIPGPVAIVLWIVASVALVYATLAWVPADWVWLQPGRSAHSRVPAGFRTGVSLVIGFVTGMVAFAEIHGPEKQPVGFPVFRLGLWGLAMSCAAVVPLVERLTGWQAAGSPFTFWLWLGMAVTWFMIYSKLFMPKA